MEESIRKPIITGKAAEDLINFRFNTEPDKLIETSILSSKQALVMAIMFTTNDGRKFAKEMAEYQQSGGKGEKPKMFFLSDRFAHYFLQAQRSTQDGKTLKDLTDLTMASVEASMEQPEDFIEPVESA